MIRRLSLSQRLALVFTSLLLLCAIAVCLLQLYSSAQYGNVMVQRLSAGLAQQIAAREPLLDAQGQVDRRMLKPLFDRLMTFNPSVELYLLSPDGELLADAAPPGRSSASASIWRRCKRSCPAAPGRCTATIRVALTSKRCLASRRCARTASCAAISTLSCRVKPLMNWRRAPGRKPCGACCFGLCCWWPVSAGWRAGLPGSG